MQPIAVLRDKRIVLGVSGSVAAYKAAWIASRLTQGGARVDVVLTRAATRFVSGLTFQSLTGRPVHGPGSLWTDAGHVLHVGLGERADLLLVAPATAHTLARLAVGLADDLLGLTALTARCPLVLVPAMDGGMFSHPASATNLATLRGRGAVVVGPAEGRMASGLVGPGRMVEPEEVVGAVRQVLGRAGPLGGRRVLVTAGPTREALDPVRFLSNRSSGRQGFALAQAAVDMGATVTLVTGPTALTAPVGAARVDVVSAADMAAAVLGRLGDTDALLMCAAVADYRPARAQRHKIRKGAVLEALSLARTDDILLKVAESGTRPPVVVGFAAESQDLLASARGKLERKGLSLIVANDITAVDAGFGTETNRVTLVHDSGEVDALDLATKAEVAERVLTEVAKRLA